MRLVHRTEEMVCPHGVGIAEVGGGQRSKRPWDGQRKRKREVDEDVGSGGECGVMGDGEGVG